MLDVSETGYRIPSERNKPVPKVSLIDYTGAGSSDKWYAAKLLVFTKNTRLEQNEDTMERIFSMGENELWKELDYISKTIRSSWEFVDYTFMIRGVTRAFTHQLVRTRTASYAQQTQRVTKLADIQVTIPDSVKNNPIAHQKWDFHESEMKRTYNALLELGIPAQDARAVLMTAVQTNIIMKTNLRTLADLIGKRESLRAQGEYANVARQMRTLVEKLHPWTVSFLEPERTRTPALDAIMKQVTDGNIFDKPHLTDALKEVDALKGIWG